MTDGPITDGCRVTLHFSLHLRDGTLVDQSHDGEPLTVVIGKGELIAGLERCLLGLRVGERGHFELAASDDYGSRADENIHLIPRNDFPAEFKVEPGMVVGFTLPSGEEVPGMVRTVSDAGVVIDFSHPLAGHDLVFDVEILSVESG